MRLFHDSRSSSYRTPYGARPVSDSVKLSLFMEDAENTKPFLRIWTDREKLVPLEAVDDSMWSVTFVLPDTPCVVWYSFQLETPDGVLYYCRSQTASGAPGPASDCLSDSWQITVYREQALPEWYRTATAYQIFPDRFARSDDWELLQSRAAHPQGWGGPGRIVVQDWYDTPFYCKDSAGCVTRWPFFGGTLSGIRSKLPYLSSLGIGVLYLNPIFLSGSNHRYDTADYMTIDPALGTEEDFQALCRDAAVWGISVLLDGVFSHSGDDSIYFNRFGNYPGPGAFSSEKSPYDEWYTFTDKEPCGYECWWGVASLPNLRETQPDFVRFICGEDGVIRKWIRLGASGWRLDVADELPEEFIRSIRQAELAERKDSLLLGEVWEDASNKISYGVLRNYFAGDELNCTMHYPFRTQAISFMLGQTSSADFAEAMEKIRENYPPTALYGALNLIGTHDTPRILTVLGEAPDGLSQQAQEEYRLPEAARQTALQRLRILQVLQFTSPGVPCIYYGDETGAEGYKDPYNRGTFPWGREDGSLQFHVRMLSHLRKEYPVLQSGNVSYSDDGPNVFSMQRKQDDQEILVYANRGADAETVRLPDSSSRLSLLRGITCHDDSITLPPLSCEVLYREGTDPTVCSSLPSHVLRPHGSGVLCPVFSLPGASGTGTLGADSYRFLEALSDLGADNWMMLPLCPAGLGNSPYSSCCVFAGDTRYIDPAIPTDWSDFPAFIDHNSFWLDDFALYTAIKADYPSPWQSWPEALRDRTDIDALKQHYSAEIGSIVRDQYRFYYQFQLLHKKARSLGISLIGDLPIYPAVDSVETWSHPEQFLLRDDGHPSLRAGCPPDYFTPDGQDWGNPLYNWNHMRSEGYQWWKERLSQAFSLFDYIRLDHFRSFAAFYAIPSGCSAKNGYWMKGAGIDFIREMAKTFGALPIIAEDLGTLDAQVSVLMAHSGLPGMNVWQFSPDLTEMPEETARNRVFFSGTHDNQTLAGFLQSRNLSITPDSVIRSLLASPAGCVIFPVQDLLSLDDSARLNIPGVPSGNWTWRMTEEQLAALHQLSLVRPVSAL